MQYFIFIEGPGEGCDYMVGCNQKFEKLKAETMLQAKIEARQRHNDFDSDKIENITIFEVNDTFECDVNGWLRSEDEAERRRAEARKETEERIEFERLSEKFAK